MPALIGSGRRFESAAMATVITCTLATAAPADSPDAPAPPPHVEDRGGEIPTSLFGTWISHREFLVYPFYEYVKNTSEEYKPSELGFPGNEDLFGELTEHELLIFLGYGITRRLAFEFEAAVWARVELTTAPEDMSGLPEKIEESGLGDTQIQLRWLWAAETRKRPLVYSFWELVFPLQDEELILGTQNWETALGFGVVRGFRWGTLDGRVSIKYDEADAQVEPGEFAIEYLKRTSPRWLWVASLEGEDDELSLIGEAQFAISRIAVLKLNSGFGLSEKAPDFAPEIGVIFSF